MLHYLSRYRRQSLDPKTTMDTYIEAYKLTHESYQSQQEADTTKISEENEKILTRTKRTAAADPDPPHEKDFIRFELTDAIQPDDKTLKHRVVNKGRNFRMPYEIADTLVVFGNRTDGIDITKPVNVTKSDDEAKDSGAKQTRRRRRKSRKEGENSKPKREIFDDDSEEDVTDDDDDDMSIGESRKIKIIAPATKTRNGEIPIGVQKIIEMVLQDRARAAKARISKGQKSYGEKFNSNQNKESQHQRQKNVVRDIHNSNNNEWRPVPQVSLGRYPVVHNQMENAPDYLTFVPVKSYKTVSYGKPVSESKQQPSPTILPVTNIVPVPQIQYIIKEVPIPVTSSLEASKLKPSFKITYDTSLLDSKFKESSIDSGYDSQTKAPSLDTSESYVKIVTPTTATKTVIDHSKKPEYKSPTAAPSYEKLSSYENSFNHHSSSPTPAPSFEKLSSYDHSPFKPSRPAYVAPSISSSYESHFESHKLDALTSLLNKDPNEQLKGFHELLQEEKKHEDTAPILFHPNGIIPPKPLVKLNIKVLDDIPQQQQQQQKKQEPITIEEFNRLYGGENGVDLPGYSPPKEFTPIKEDSPADNFESYKTSFKSITEPAKSTYKNTKVQYKHHHPLPAISEVKGPVIQHHDHAAHLTSGGISKGYDDESKVSTIYLYYETKSIA